MNWVEIAKSMVALGAVAGTAWRAWSTRGAAGDPPRLLVRVLVSAGVLAVAFSAILALSEVPLGLGHVALMAIGGAIFFPPVLALLLLIVELIVWRMRPIRSGKWLVASIFLFCLVMVIIPALLVSVSGIGEAGSVASGESAEIVLGPAPEGSDEANGWEVLQVFAIICAGALAWWSHLPRVRRRLTDVFA